MKLVVDVPNAEYKAYKFLFNVGMGNTAIRRILDGEPYEEGIKWHPYPKENPPRDDMSVLVTFYMNEQYHVAICYWCDIIIGFGTVRDCIFAWAELPKPYEGGAEE